VAILECNHQHDGKDYDIQVDEQESCQYSIGLPYQEEKTVNYKEIIYFNLLALYLTRLITLNT